MAGIFSSLFGAMGVEVVGGGALDKAAELLFEKSGKEALEEIQDRLKAYSGKIPPNHNLEHALRLCELTATLTLLFAYRRDHELAHGHDRTPPPRPPFIDGAISWVHQQIGLSPSLQVTQDAELISELNRQLDAILPAERPEQVRAALQEAERQVWADLAAGAGHAPPPDFEVWFRGTHEGKPGWSLVFLAFVREAMKERPRVKIAFDTSRLSMLVTTLREVNSKVDLIIERLDLQPQLNALQSELGLTQGYLRTLLALLLKKDVPPEQFPLAIAEAAQKWAEANPARQGARGDNLEPELGRLRKQAEEAYAANEIERFYELRSEIVAVRERAMARIRREREELEALEAAFEADLIPDLDEKLGAAIAALNAAGAAAAIVRKLELETEDPDALFAAIRAVQNEWYERGRDKGLNFDLDVSIEIARLSLGHAGSADQRGAAANDLGIALWALGERESGTARLEQAVAAYRAALEERTRDRVPLDWAMTQTNLGTALSSLGQREAGTTRLEEAIAAYRAALEERTRERMPLDWAGTQVNLGATLRTLGVRKRNKERLDEAVTAYRAALEERTRERAPLDWARTQMNLGNALVNLGQLESGTARLEEAVAAYHEALKEVTRDRVPLHWAGTQMNLGNALLVLGQREEGTARLEQAVAAYRAALEEFTRERVPLDWANALGNQGVAFITLAERTGDLALAKRGLEQLETAETVLREGGHVAWAETFERQIPDARALVARLSGAG